MQPHIMVDRFMQVPDEWAPLYQNCFFYLKFKQEIKYSTYSLYYFVRVTF